MRKSSNAQTAQNQPLQTIDTVTMPRELYHDLDNAAYFYGMALEHIDNAFIPSLKLAAEKGDLSLIGHQLNALSDFILQYTEQYQGIQASIRGHDLENDGVLTRSKAEIKADTAA